MLGPVRIAGVIAFVLALSGCGGSAKRADKPLPSGYVKVTIGGVTFAHPKAWAMQRKTDNGDAVVNFAPAGGAPKPIVSLLLPGKADPDLTALRGLRDLAISGQEVREKRADKDIDVPGAAKAHLIDRIVASMAPGATTARYAEIVAVTAKGRQAVLTAAKPEGSDLDVDAVLDSLRLPG